MQNIFLKTNKNQEYDFLNKKKLILEIDSEDFSADDTDEIDDLGETASESSIIETVKLLRSKKKVINNLRTSALQALNEEAKKEKEFFSKEQFEEIIKKFDEFFLDEKNQNYKSQEDLIEKYIIDNIFKGGLFEEDLVFSATTSTPVFKKEIYDFFSGDESKRGFNKDSVFLKNDSIYVELGELHEPIEFKISADNFKKLLRLYVFDIFKSSATAYKDLLKKIKDYEKDKKIITNMIFSESFIKKQFAGKQIGQILKEKIELSKNKYINNCFIKNHKFLSDNGSYDISATPRKYFYKKGKKSQTQIIENTNNIFISFEANSDGQSFFLEKQNKGFVLDEIDINSNTIENNFIVFNDKDKNKFLFHVKNENNRYIFTFSLEKKFGYDFKDLSNKKPGDFISSKEKEFSFDDDEIKKILDDSDGLFNCYFKKDDLNNNDHIINKLLFQPITLFELGLENRKVTLKNFFNKQNVFNKNNRLLGTEKRGSKDAEYFFSPYAFLCFLSIKLTLSSTSFVYELFRINFEKAYRKLLYGDASEGIEGELKKHFVNFDKNNFEADQNEGKLFFKSGDAKNNLVEFVEKIFNSPAGVFKYKIFELFFETNLENETLKNYLNYIKNPETSFIEDNKEINAHFGGTQIKGNEKLDIQTIRKFEDLCVKQIFNLKPSSSVGAGEYLLIALLMGIDIPASLCLNRNNIDIKEKVNNLVTRILFYSGGQETGDIDFKTHPLPSECPTKDLIEGKVFEVKEGGTVPVRLGAEGIRALSKHMSKFYEHTTAIKTLFESEQGKYLISEICERIHKSPVIDKIINTFNSGLLPDETQIDKNSVIRFISQFFYTDLNKYLHGDSFVEKTVYGEIDSFNSGNFSIERLKHLFLIHVVLLKVLKTIIEDFSGVKKDEQENYLQNEEHKVTFKQLENGKEINSSEFLLPLNASLEINKKKKENFMISLLNLIDIIHEDHESHNVINSFATKHDKNDSIPLLTDSVKIYKKLKNINLYEVFKNDSISLNHFLNNVENKFISEIVDDFGDAQKSFEKMDGVFLIQGKISKKTTLHHDLRFLFVPKNNLKEQLTLKKVSKMLPSFEVTMQKLKDISAKEFFGTLRVNGVEEI